jgi:hypothetical protein
VAQSALLCSSIKTGSRRATKSAKVLLFFSVGPDITERIIAGAHQRGDPACPVPITMPSKCVMIRLTLAPAPDGRDAAQVRARLNAF